ncbi:MAG: hypothetical protein RIG61_11465 [Deltaproteobacteria bacterium]
MPEPNNTVTVDLPVVLPKDTGGIAGYFSEALRYIDRLYQSELTGGITPSRENTLWKGLTDKLSQGSGYLAGPEREAYEAGVYSVQKGIFDLYPLFAGNSNSGGIELIIGKVFSSGGGGKRFYAGAAGVFNRNFDNTIKEYDSRLPLFADKLTDLQGSVVYSPGKQVPEISCIDVFSLAGALDVSHKPICIFYSGGSKENLSSLSRMTVFINLYAARFKALTETIARRYINASGGLEELTYEDTAKLLLIWLRGHDVGHFMGTDCLGKAMSELDRDYMILHELKSDMIALYNMRWLADGLLADGLLKQAYLVSVAEMLRYIRRGGCYIHPDTGSAYLTYRMFRDKGAIGFDEKTGRFQVDLKLFEDAVEECAGRLIKLFSDGDILGARGLVNSWGRLAPEKDGLPQGCPDELRLLMTDTDLPFYTDFNFSVSGMSSGARKAKR